MPATLHAPPGVLNPVSWGQLAAPVLDRAAPDVKQQLVALVRDRAQGWPLAADAPALATWRELATLGRGDLTVARLVEGHVDALRILAEAGRKPYPEAVYGVWASASGGTGLAGAPVTSGGRTDRWLVDGTMRYCSGAWFIDHALVVISTAAGHRLVDVDVRAAQAPGGPLSRRDDTWPAVGMDVTSSVDVAVRGLPVEPADFVGQPGFYVDRPGFAAGGVGVAAVWLGGAAGVLDALVRSLASRPASVSAHQRAHLGVIGVSIAAADAVLAELAGQVDQGPAPARKLPGGWADALAARSAVERAVDTVLQRAPRVSGVTPLCRDAAFAHRMADLAVYVRQHHAEVDYEELGSGLLESGTLLGRTFA